MKWNKILLMLLALFVGSLAHATVITIEGHVINNPKSPLLIEYSTDGWKTIDSTYADTTGYWNDSFSTNQSAVGVYLQVKNCYNTYDSAYLTWSVRDSSTVLYTTLSYCRNQGKKCYASFGHSISGRTVTFSNSSTGFNPVYTWNFGDRSTSSAKNPSHTYSQDGTYNVCLYISDSVNNCSDSVCLSITVGGSTNRCVAGFRGGYTYDSANNPVLILTNFSSVSSNAKYLWTVSNGDTFHTKDVTSPIAAGAYLVCLTVIDGNCTDKFCDSLVVDTFSRGRHCFANFTYTVNGKTVKYLNGSKGGTHFYWKIGNSFSTNRKDTTVTYNSYGTYTTCLYIYDSITQCSDTICKAITLSAPNTNCAAKFAVVKDTNNKYGVTILNRSTGSNLNYFWDFGDGNSSSQKNPTHTYSSFGKYYLCLTVSDSARCRSTYCDTIGMDSSGKLLKAGFSITVVDDLVGVEDIDLKSTITAFPNPTNGDVTVSSSFAKMNDVKVYDMRGQLISNIEILHAGPNEINIKTSELSDGIYLFLIETEAGRTTKQIQKW